MDVNVVIPEKLYKALKQHLFTGRKEQGAFLFASETSGVSEMNLTAADIYLIPPSAWDVQESTYLELSDEEKVKIMIMAKKRDCHLIECHSHRSPYGAACFSPSDIYGLEEFVSYVRWKLPGKKYGALVWAKDSVCGQIWDGTNPTPLPVKEVRIIRKSGSYQTIKPPIQKKRNKIFFGANRFKRGNK
jgi:hypothetical protein